METFLARLRNPSANPSEIEEEIVYAESADEAREEAERLIDNHPFADVELISVELLPPGNLYHETT